MTTASFPLAAVTVTVTCATSSGWPKSSTVRTAFGQMTLEVDPNPAVQLKVVLMDTFVVPSAGFGLLACPGSVGVGAPATGNVAEPPRLETTVTNEGGERGDNGLTFSSYRFLSLLNVIWPKRESSTCEQPAADRQLPFSRYLISAK